MANLAPALGRSSTPRNRHVYSPNIAALQGALTAFHGTSPGDPQRHLNHRLTPTMTATGITRHVSGPASLPDHSGSPEPEVGTVRDKIAKFSANSNREILEDNNNISRAARGQISASRAQSPQQIAAQLAVTRSPIPPRKKTGLGTQPTRLEQSNGEKDLELHCPIPIRRRLTGTGPVSEILPTPPGPTLPSTPVSSIAQPEITRLAASKPRPIPPKTRKPGVVTNGPTSTPQDSRSEVSLSSHPSLRSKASSSTLSGERAAAPSSQRGASSVSKRNVTSQRLPVEEKKLQVRPSSSSATSTISQSQNQRSAGTLDSATDAGVNIPSDAVVASSLASSRALQTKKSPPQPPPQRRRRSRSVKDKPHQDQVHPTSSLRHTLRGQVKSDDEGDHHHRHRRPHHYTKHIIHKHPHKHHEGDRRRWRSEVTEKERKRYEGVWAANKGLLIPSNLAALPETYSQTYPPNASEMVVNLVVRDIWSRSRLSAYALEQIWELVDNQKIGLLTREEFVVGMWLIDQQLKGHKLPVAVPDSVWGSVKRVSGISLAELHV